MVRVRPAAEWVVAPVGGAIAGPLVVDQRVVETPPVQVSNPPLRPAHGVEQGKAAT